MPSAWLLSAWLVAAAWGAPGVAGGAPRRFAAVDSRIPPRACSAPDSGSPWLAALTDVEYCRALARGYAALAGEPKRAQEWAARALAMRTDSPAQLLLARAQLAAGDASAAFRTFQAA